MSYYADGWYKVTSKHGTVTIQQVEDDTAKHGPLGGYPVAWLISHGATVEPVIVLTRAELDQAIVNAYVKGVAAQLEASDEADITLPALG